MAVANTSNISTIQILRSYANSAPTSLEDGQLAFSFLSNTLFIGYNTGSVIAISDQATANLARELANTKVNRIGDTITGPLYFLGPDFAVGNFQTGAGYGIDFWASSNSGYAQINYANTNFVYVDSGSAVIQSPNALIGADITGNATITLTSGAYNNVWIFNKDSSLHFPDSSKQWTAAAPIAYTQAAYDTANAAYSLANTETVRAGWAANTVLFANSTGYISNSNLFFTASNNTLTINNGGITANGRIIVGNQIYHANIANVLNVSVSSGNSAIRAINLVDSAAVMKIARSGNNPSIELQQWDNTLSTLQGYWEAVAVANNFYIRDRVSGSSKIRLAIDPSGNITFPTVTSTSTSNNTGAMVVPSLGVTGNINSDYVYSGGYYYKDGTPITNTANNASAIGGATLNDYETGTWTPTIIGTSSSPTYTVTSSAARYVKVGQMVYVEAYIYCSGGLSGGTGALGISGFPFTTTNVTDYRFIPMGYNGISGSYASGFSRMQLYQNAITGVYYNGTSNVSLPVSAGIFEFSFTGTYLASF